MSTALQVAGAPGAFFSAWWLTILHFDLLAYIHTTTIQHYIFILNDNLVP